MIGIVKSLGGDLGHLIRVSRYPGFSPLAILTLLSCGFVNLQAASEASTQNSSSGTLLFPRYGPTAVADGEWIYVYGGAPSGGRNGPDFMHEGLHASIERVHPKTLRSEYVSSGLHRRANHASVLLDNNLVSCGGRSQIGLSRPKLQSCEFWDLQTLLFREMPGLPEAVRTLGLVEVEGTLYAVGGVKDGPRFSMGTYRLKKGGSRWESLENAPLGVSGQAVALGHRIYLLGGYNGRAMASVQVFDTKTLGWQRLQDLPYPLSAYSAVADGRSIFLFGDYQRMETIHRYETETGELYLLNQKITPRRHTAAVVVDGTAFVLGGNQSSSAVALKLIEAFDLNLLRTGGRLASN